MAVSLTNILEGVFKSHISDSLDYNLLTILLSYKNNRIFEEDKKKKKNNKEEKEEKKTEEDKKKDKNEKLIIGGVGTTSTTLSTRFLLCARVKEVERL